jgi:hypothetical protein
MSAGLSRAASSTIPGAAIVSSTVRTPVTSGTGFQAISSTASR